jgi:hypothetical protein
VTPQYIIVQERVKENSSWRGVATVGAVGAVGVLLYLLIKNVGFGSGKSGRGEPQMPKDEQRLEFVMIHPTPDEHPRIPMGFRGPGAKIYSLEEMIARVKAGDRIDVTLKIMGDVRHGSVMEARTLIKQAGIEISTAGAPHDA